MKNVNHLKLDKALKKKLNSSLKRYYKYRIGELQVSQNKPNESGSSFLGLLFKEYDSMNDLMKDFSSQFRSKSTV